MLLMTCKSAQHEDTVSTENQTGSLAGLEMIWSKYKHTHKKNMEPTWRAPVEGALLGVAGAAVQRALERPFLINRCNVAIWGQSRP